MLSVNEKWIKKWRNGLRNGEMEFEKEKCNK